MCFERGLTLLAALSVSAALFLVCLLAFTLTGQQTTKQAAVTGHRTQIRLTQLSNCSLHTRAYRSQSAGVSQSVRTLINESVSSPLNTLSHYKSLGWSSLFLCVCFLFTYLWKLTPPCDDTPLSCCYTDTVSCTHTHRGNTSWVFSVFKKTQIWSFLLWICHMKS